MKSTPMNIIKPIDLLNRLDNLKDETNHKISNFNKDPKYNSDYLKGQLDAYQKTIELVELMIVNNLSVKNIN